MLVSNVTMKQNLYGNREFFDDLVVFFPLDIQRVFGSNPIYLAHLRLLQHDETYLLYKKFEAAQKFGDY